MQEIYRIEIARPFEVFELSQWIRTHYNIEKHISFMDYQYTPNTDLEYERLIENRWGWAADSFENSEKKTFGIIMYFVDPNDAMLFQLGMSGELNV